MVNAYNKFLRQTLVYEESGGIGISIESTGVSAVHSLEASPRELLFKTPCCRIQSRAVLAVLSLALPAIPLLLVGTSAVYAQNTNATIRGQVLDPSGALVPNATVVVLNEATG